MASSFTKIYEISLSHLIEKINSFLKDIDLLGHYNLIFPPGIQQNGTLQN